MRLILRRPALWNRIPGADVKLNRDANIGRKAPDQPRQFVPRDLARLQRGLGDKA